MKIRINGITLPVLIVLLIGCTTEPKENNVLSDSKYSGNAGLSKPIIIIWANDNKEIATQFVLDYALNARMNGWVEDISIFIWGPSVKLVAEDNEIQNLLKALQTTGVKIVANKPSADNYELSDKIRRLNIEVDNLGKRLTRAVEENYSILSF